MNRDQDPEIARALADMQVPDHAPDFWDRLDRRLERAARAEAAGLTPVAPPAPLAPVVAIETIDSLDLRDVPAPRDEPPPDIRTTTGELPSVAELRPPAPSPRRQKLWFVAAAVVLAVVISSAALLASGNDPDGTSPADQAADQSVTTDTTDSSEDSSDVTTLATDAPPPTVAAARPSPETVVVEWLEAVSAGDVALATTLTGPRSVEYLASQGGDASLEAALTDSADGFGAMAGAPDLAVEAVPLGAYDFGEVVLVAVTGRFAGDDGVTGSTTFVFPVVTSDGVSVVEPWAFSPEAGGELEFTQPRVQEGQPNLMEPDAAIELFTPVDGTAWFKLDDGEEGVRPDDTSPVGQDPAPFARYDPPGDMARGEHLAIVGFMSPDGGVIVGQALTFEVV